MGWSRLTDDPWEEKNATTPPGEETRGVICILVSFVLSSAVRLSLSRVLLLDYLRWYIYVEMVIAIDVYSE